MNKKFLLGALAFPCISLGLSINPSKRNIENVNAESPLITTLDFTTSSDDVRTIDGSSLITALVNNPSEEEKDFVNKHYQIKYNLPKFHTEQIGSEQIISPIKTSLNSNESFISTEVDVDGTSYEFNETRDELSDVAVIPQTDVSNADVVYNHYIKLNESTVNEIINAAYNAGKLEIEKEDAHNAYTKLIDDVQEYEINIKKYNDYQSAHYQWSEKNEIYQKFLSSQESYRKAKEAYDKYLEELRAYENLLSKYKKYLVDLDAYNTNKPSVDAIEKQFESDFEIINYQLGIMDLVYTVFPNVENGGTLYSYVFRDAVDQVLARENELKVLGVSSTAIEKAGIATAALRKLFEEYNTIRLSKDKRAMYEYYVNNFFRIRSNTISLAQCLEKFLEFNSVREMMDAKGKTERYVYLVAELIYVGEYFSDIPIACYDKAYGGGNEDYVLDSNHKILGKTVASILGVDAPVKSYSMQTVASYPIDVSIVYGAEPNYRDYDLESPDRPSKPKEVPAPELPDSESAPGDEPKPEDFGLNNNIRPTKPLVLGEEPEGRDSNNDLAYDLVKSGLLSKREVTKTQIVLEESLPLASAKDDEIPYSLTSNVTFKVDDEVTYELVNVINGSEIGYGGITPKKEETSNAKYEFIGWEVDGEAVTLPIYVNEDIELNAKFKTINKFNVSFKFGDEINYSLIVDEGETPVAPNIDALSKSPEVDTYYEFTSWDKEVGPVMMDTTYEANYASKKIISNATITRYGKNLHIDVDPNYDSLDLSKLLELIGEGYEIIDVTINFSFASMKLSQADIYHLISSNVKKLSLVKSTLKSGEEKINFVLKDKDENLITDRIDVEVLLSNYPEQDHLVVLRDDNKKVQFETKKNELQFTMSANSEVVLGIYYKVAVDDYSTSTFKLNGEMVDAGNYITVRKGTKVTISATAPDEHSSVTSLLAVDTDLKPVKKSYDRNSMTVTVLKDITVYANLERKSYTIKLLRDGDVAFTLKAIYGSKILLPSLMKHGTNDYYYSFLGYEGLDSLLYEVKGDATLNAVFTKTKIEDEQLSKSSTPIAKIAAYCVLGTVVLGSITAVIIVATKKQKTSKKSK